MQCPHNERIFSLCFTPLGELQCDSAVAVPQHVGVDDVNDGGQVGQRGCYNGSGSLVN